MRPLSQRDIVKRLRKLGWEGPVRGGKHPHMVKGDQAVAVPNPHRGDLSVAFIRQLLRAAGIAAEEWDAAE